MTYVIVKRWRNRFEETLFSFLPPKEQVPL